jgi:hypothetical protein
MLATAHLDDVTCSDLTWASIVRETGLAEFAAGVAAEGKTQWLGELKPFYAAGGGTRSNQMKSRLDLVVPIATLRTWLSRLRQRYRDLLRHGSGEHRFRSG